MRRFAVLSFIILVGCQFQASCGGGNLDMAAAKELVSSALAADVGEKPAAVTCPDTVKPEAGATFECTADYGNGATAKVVIKQDDDKGNVTVTGVSGILVARKAEAAIAKGIGEQLNVHVEVDCGQRFRPSVAGGSFTCAVKDAKGESATVEVQVKDDAGNISWRIKNP